MSADVVLSKLTIREYRDSDYEVCRELWAELVRYHKDLYDDFTLGGSDPGSRFDNYLNNPIRHGTWVAEIQEKIIGMGGLFIESHVHAEVEPMIVSQTYRGQGIGKALMREIVNAAEKAGVRFLSISPGARNADSLAAYVKMGFNSVWTVQLIRELKPEPGIKWQPGLKIHDNELGY